MPSITPFPLVNPNPKFKEPFDIFKYVDSTENLVERYQPTGWQVRVFATLRNSTEPDMRPDLPCPSVHPNGDMLAIETFEDRPSMTIFSQHAIPLKKGQRYVLALEGIGQLHHLGIGDQSAMMVRVVYHTQSGDVVRPWNVFPWDQQTTLLLEVFDSAVTQVIGYSIEFHCRFGNIDGKINLVRCTLEEVGLDYRNDHNIVVPPGYTAPVPDPEPQPPTQPEPASPFSWPLFAFAALAVILSVLLVLLFSNRQQSFQVAQALASTSLSPADFFQNLIVMIYTVTASPLTANLVVLLTNALKVFLPINPQLVSLTIQTALWVIVVIAQAMGYGKYMQTVFDIFQMILQVFGIPLLGLSLSLWQQKAIYDRAKMKQVQAVGTSVPDHKTIFAKFFSGKARDEPKRAKAA